MNESTRVARLVQTLVSETDLSPKQISELLNEPIRIDRNTIYDLRNRLESQSEAHVYPDGIYGAPCVRCQCRPGVRSKCIPAQDIQIDRETLIALLDVADVAIVAPPVDVAIELGRLLRRRMSVDPKVINGHCGCEAQDAEVCPEHRALHNLHRIQEHLQSKDKSHG